MSTAIASVLAIRCVALLVKINLTAKLVWWMYTSSPSEASGGHQWFGDVGRLECHRADLFSFGTHGDAFLKLVGEDASLVVRYLPPFRDPDDDITRCPLAKCNGATTSAAPFESDVDEGRCVATPGVAAAQWHGIVNCVKIAQSLWVSWRGTGEAFVMRRTVLVVVFVVISSTVIRVRATRAMRVVDGMKGVCLA